MLDEPNSVADNGMLLFELFSCKDNLTGRHSSAWPRPVGYKHMLCLGSGCAPNETKEVSDSARRSIMRAPEEIFGKTMKEVDTIPNCIEDYHDVERIYGSHLEKLRQVKTRVDPTDRLQGWIKPSRHDSV